MGSLLQIMILRHLQKAGHQPIVLLGGGTTKIGDPSGKDESRQMLTEATIQVSYHVLSRCQIAERYEHVAAHVDLPYMLLTSRRRT